MNLEEGTLVMAIDVGKGTEDVLVYRVGDSYENSIQLVLPSMTQIIHQRIAKHHGRVIRIDGDLMAGEPWHKLVYNWEGNVLMTKKAAMSLKYDLDIVQKRGITIVDELEKADIVLSDIGWGRIKGILASSNIETEHINYLLLCAQEHGNPQEGESVKDFRMDHVWGESPFLWSRLMRGDNVPSIFPRFQSLVSAALREFPHLNADSIYVMDSAIAVLLGAMNPLEEELVVNIGNGHVSAIHHVSGRVLYVYEGHTGRFDSEDFFSDINAIYRGDLTHQHVLEKGGHGLKLIDPTEVKKRGIPGKVVTLGPNRQKIPPGLCEYVHPIGNMMMAGPYGLLQALYRV